MPPEGWWAQSSVKPAHAKGRMICYQEKKLFSPDKSKMKAHVITSEMTFLPAPISRRKC